MAKTRCRQNNVRPYAERFWTKVDKDGPNGCWMWTASTYSNGYGQFEIRYAKALAHRIAYELLVGAVPEGFDLHHRCNNPRCVNPDHLEPLSRRDHQLRSNSLTASNLAKTHCPRGHPFDLLNTYFAPSGHRQCRTCRQIHARAYDWRHRAARDLARAAERSSAPLHPEATQVAQE